MSGRWLSSPERSLQGSLVIPRVASICGGEVPIRYLGGPRKQLSGLPRKSPSTSHLPRIFYSEQRFNCNTTSILLYSSSRTYLFFCDTSGVCFDTAWYDHHRCILPCSLFAELEHVDHDRAMLLISRSLSVSDEINIVGVVVSFIAGIVSSSLAYVTWRYRTPVQPRRGTCYLLRRIFFEL